MRLLDAFSLTARLHAGQLDKAGEPYIQHCVRVMFRLPIDASMDEKMAALLHDVVEDCDVSAADLVALGVPDGVVRLVGALTKQAGEPYAEFVKRALAGPAGRIKRADIQDNSDPERLAKLPPELADRLRAKYAGLL